MRISHVIDMIHTRINIDIALKNLAEKVFMSESYFSHVFKDIIGFSPKQYVIQAKIEKAKELLITTQEPVVEIAGSLGIDNPHYFSRLFKKECVCTPLQYRKKKRKVHSL